MSSSTSDHRGGTALHHAAKKRDLIKIQQLIHAGADVNATTKRNETAIHVHLSRSNANQQLEIVRLLVEHGADDNAVYTLG